MTRISILLRNGSTMLLLGRGIQLLNSFALSLIVLKRFGLQMVGTFAIAFVAVTILSCLSPLGMTSHLPRVRHTHDRLCYSALIVQAVAIIPVSLLVVAFAEFEAHRSEEIKIIAAVAFGGYLSGAMNVGMTLRIMNRSFYPGFAAPLLEAVGLLAGAFVAQTPMALVGWQLSGRTLGLLLVWAGLRFARAPFPDTLSILTRSVQYTIPDTLAMISEQSAPLLLGVMVSRPELGMFRLCQQFLTAADTPGWTFVQSKYPDLVGASKAHIGHLERQVGRLSLFASALCCACSCLIATFAYKLPKLDLMMLLLSASVFWRYKNSFFDQVIRAAGRIKTSNALAIAKLAFSFVLFVPLVRYFGIWGALVSLTILSVVSGIAYGEMSRRHDPLTFHSEPAI